MVEWSKNVKNTARVDVLSWKPSFFQIVIDQEPFLAMGTMATHQSITVMIQVKLVILDTLW